MRINLSDILNRVLNEAISPNDVIPVINNRNYVNLNYVDEDGSAVGPRLVQPYAYGRSSAGNPVVRIYQVSGDSLRKREWKTLRLDRIVSWKPRQQTFSKPAPGYNEDGDRSMEIVYTMANFDTRNLSPLEKQQRVTADIANAPKVSTKKSIGPLQYASQQRKKNVYTSQPNSDRYRMYQKNISDTEKEMNRFDDDIWAKAEAERNQQDMQKMQNDAPKPQQRISGPLGNGGKNNENKNK